MSVQRPVRMDGVLNRQREATEDQMLNAVLTATIETASVGTLDAAASWTALSVRAAGTQTSAESGTAGALLANSTPFAVASDSDDVSA
ncbi:hypothetical protein ACH4MM_03910 [Streptomyces pratensis]|uniref:hypothetical protein n=1 Tax=Streptomyces pratensis TaxID=1169025 RepID=UPI0037A8DC20